MSSFSLHIRRFKTQRVKAISFDIDVLSALTFQLTAPLGNNWMLRIGGSLDQELEPSSASGKSLATPYNTRKKISNFPLLSNLPLMELSSSGGKHQGAPLAGS